MPAMPDKKILDKYGVIALKEIADEINAIFDLQGNDFIDTNKSEIQILIGIKNNLFFVAKGDLKEFSKDAKSLIKDMDIEPINSDDADEVNAIGLERLNAHKKSMRKSATKKSTVKKTTAKKSVPKTSSKKTTSKSQQKSTSKKPTNTKTASKKTAKKKSANISKQKDSSNANKNDVSNKSKSNTSKKKSISKTKHGNVGISTLGRQKEPRRRIPFSTVDALCLAIKKLCKKKAGATRAELAKEALEIYEQKTGNKRDLKSFTYVPTHVCASLLHFDVLEVNEEKNTLVLVK